MKNEFGKLLTKYRKARRLSSRGLLNLLWDTEICDREDSDGKLRHKYNEPDVSKWGSGTSKPPSDVVDALENILFIPKGLLLEAAGYHDAAELKKSHEGKSKGREETKVPSDLVKRWKEQLQYPTPSQLLYEFKLKNLEADVLSYATENEEVFEMYHSAQRVHAQRVHHKVATSTADRVLVELEEKEPLFTRLRTQFAGDSVWELYESWGYKYYAYIKAFSLWFTNLEGVIKVAFLANVDERLVDLVDAEPDKSLLLLKKELGGNVQQAADFECAMHLTSLVVGCDVLCLGFAQLSSQFFWFSEISAIRKFRSSLILYGGKLVRSYPFETGHYNRIAGVLLNNPNDPEDKLEVKVQTKDYLDRLVDLQEAQDKLRSHLSSFGGYFNERDA